jgi:hypothetical protein
MRSIGTCEVRTRPLAKHPDIIDPFDITGIGSPLPGLHFNDVTLRCLLHSICLESASTSGLREGKKTDPESAIAGHWRFAPMPAF